MTARATAIADEILEQAELVSDNCFEHVLNEYDLYNSHGRKLALHYISEQQAKVTTTTTTTETTDMLVVDTFTKDSINLDARDLPQFTTVAAAKAKATKVEPVISEPAPQAPPLLKSAQQLALEALLVDINNSIEALVKRRDETEKALAAYEPAPALEPTKKATATKKAQVSVAYTKETKAVTELDSKRLYDDVVNNRHGNLFVVRAMCNRWLEANGHNTLSSTTKLAQVKEVAASIVEGTLAPATAIVNKETKATKTKEAAVNPPSAKALRDAAKAQGVDISSTNMRSPIERREAGKKLSLC
jgi:hypothetical protein